MGITHKVVNFKFDAEAWQIAIGLARTVLDDDVIGAMIGATGSIVRQWATGGLKDDYPYPSMTLFIRACNVLDLNPAMFFILDE